MYETGFPLDAPRKARALLLTPQLDFICLGRLKPGRPVYHVTVGGTLEPGEETATALARELQEELDATALIGRPLLTLLDTTYHVALLTHLGPRPFNGPEFSDPALGRYTMVRVPLHVAGDRSFDLQPKLLKGFLHTYGEAIAAEGRRLLASLPAVPAITLPGERRQP